MFSSWFYFLTRKQKTNNNYKNDFKKALGSDERVNKALGADRAFMGMIKEELQNRRGDKGPKGDKGQGGKNKRGGTPPPPPPPGQEEPTIFSHWSLVS